MTESIDSAAEADHPEFYRQPEFWKLWVSWAARTVLAYILIGFTDWAIGGFVAWGSAVVEAMGESAENMPAKYVFLFVFSVVHAAIIGAFIGVMQYRVLRKRIERSLNWVWATSLGGVIAALIANAAINVLDIAQSPLARSDLVLIPTAILAYAARGTVQWTVLRGQLSRAKWWIVASAVLAATYWPIARVPSGLPPTIGEGLLGGLGANAIAGALAGGVMAWILLEAPSEQTNADGLAVGP